MNLGLVLAKFPQGNGAMDDELKEVRLKSETMDEFKDVKVKFVRKDRNLTFSYQRFLDFIPLLPTFSQ
jgi:hypothetical protein